MDIHADSIYRRTGYGVTSYFRSAFIEVIKAAENAASDGFGSFFSGASFCLTHQFVGHLVFICQYPERGVSCQWSVHDMHFLMFLDVCCLTTDDYISLVVRTVFFINKYESLKLIFNMCLEAISCWHYLSLIVDSQTNEQINAFCSFV